ncbi:MAG: hypothetical protein COA79_14845 [Planctomycetota bacterium]|nr:MAG: hypothetical protein COA79_14845 [Planctomycetota bacterium]
MYYSPWIVSDNRPDFFSLKHILMDSRFQDKAGEELIITIWKLIVDRDLGLFHYSPYEDQFTAKDTHDPMLTFNSFGYTICHCHAHIMAMLCQEAGFEVRIANIMGHEGAEVFYDNAWHYFDADIQMYYHKHPPEQNIIASREDLFQDVTLITKQKNPSNPFHFPDRLPENFYKLYASEPSYLPVLAERLHSMSFRIRPGESLHRYFYQRGYWYVSPGHPKNFERHSSFKNGIGPKETGAEGPTERFWPRRQWGNGYWSYIPNLTKGYNDIYEGSESIRGFEQNEMGLVTADAKACFRLSFESPYIYCGIPDPLKRLPAVNGAVLKLKFNKSSNVDIAILEIGDDRRQISKSFSNASEITFDYTEFIEGSCHFEMEIMIKSKDVILTEFQNVLWCMVSPHSLPPLHKLGANNFKFHLGDEHGDNTRPFRINYDMTEDATEIPGAVKTENAKYDGTSVAKIIAIDEDKSWASIFAFESPRRGNIAWAEIYAVIGGRFPEEQSRDIPPVKILSSEFIEGPYEEINSHEIVEHPQGWHFGLHSRAFYSKTKKKVFIKIVSPKGLKYIRFTGHDIEIQEQKSEQKLEITHQWYEEDPHVGRRLKEHTEKINGPADYIVQSKNEPHNEGITIACPSQPIS